MYSINVKKSNRLNIQRVFSSCTKHTLSERLHQRKNVKARLCDQLTYSIPKLQK